MARGLIYAARHPRPALSARICLGRTDVELAESAETGAETLLARLDLPDWEKLARIVTSPLRRARDTAQALARLTGARLHADDRLTDTDYAAWEGRAWTAIPRAELDAWAADPLGYRPGSGESMQHVLDRVRRAWTGLASSADATLVVSHAAPIRCLLHVAQGVPMQEAIRADVAFGAMLRLGR